MGSFFLHSGNTLIEGRGGNDHEARPTYRKYIRLCAFIHRSWYFSCHRAERLCSYDARLAISICNDLCDGMPRMATGYLAAFAQCQDRSSKNHCCLSCPHFPCKLICCARGNSISRSRKHRSVFAMDKTDRTANSDYMGDVHCKMGKKAETMITKS